MKANIEFRARWGFEKHGEEEGLKS